MADVLHMQTIHHLGYAELAEGIRVGLRAAEVFERRVRCGISAACKCS